MITNILQTVLFLAIDALADPNNRVYVSFTVFIRIDRKLFSSIPSTSIWFIYKEDKKQVAKLDGLLSTIDYPS